jgi:hypothetical protein
VNLKNSEIYLLKAYSKNNLDIFNQLPFQLLLTNIE